MKTSLQEFNLDTALKDKYVVYIDVLGFSDLVNSNNNDRLQDYFDTINNSIKDLKEISEKIDFKYITFSDSIVIIADDDPEDFINLLVAVQKIQTQLILINVYVRGAISYGPIYYNSENGVLVGKGLVKAYNLEKEAVFPRIIIDQNIILDNFKTDRQSFINEHRTYNGETKLLNHIRPHGHKIKTINHDDIPFVCYADKLLYDNYKNPLVLDSIYEYLKNSTYRSMATYSKYAWVRDYFIDSAFDLRLTNLYRDSDNLDKINYNSFEHKISML